MTDKKNLAGADGSLGFREIILILGLALLSVGLWWIFPPASLIVPGLILIGISIFGVKK